MNPAYSNEENGAIFSDDTIYRYMLWRRWNPMLPKMLAIGTNPSTADASKNDPTVGKLLAAAKRLGFGELLVCNLFAFRATDPADMRAHPYPHGKLNDFYIRECAGLASQIVAVWGDDGLFLARGEQVLQLIRNLDCFATNASGQPRHPRFPGSLGTPVPYARDGKQVAGIADVT